METTHKAANVAEIFINQSNNDTVTNNITTATNTPPPAAPVISSDTVSGNSVTLNGTAAANSAITVFDNSTKLGAATTNSSGAWTFTTGALANGGQSFTATATDAAGNVSPLSSALVVTLAGSSGSTGGNLVTNGSFETDSLSGWTVGGNSAVISAGPQLSVDKTAESGAYAAAMGSMGSDGTLSQTIATTAGGTYTLSFWLQNEASGANDFNAIWNGQTLLSLTNAAQSGYTQYTYSVTATGSASTLEFSARNDPSQWDLDNISLTAGGTSSTPPPPPPATTPTLSIANSSLSVTGRGGTVGLGITVTAPPAATATTVTIAGLPQYEVITDGLLDGKTFNGTSIVLSEAEANSGLTLTSNYKGHEHPVATLTVTASDTIDGVSSVSAPQTITVTDPPPSTSTAGDLTNGGAESGYFTFEPFHGAHAIADFASPNLTNSDWAGLPSLLTGDKNMGSYLATGSAYGEEHDLLGLNVAAVAGPKANSVSTGDAARWA